MQDPAPNATDEPTAPSEHDRPNGAGANDGAPAAPGTGASTGACGPGEGAESDDGVGRRRVLRTLVNGGYGAGVLAAFEGWRGIGGHGEEVTITYAFARARDGDASGLVARTTSVPRRWRERLELSFEVRDEIADLGLDGLLELFVVPGPVDSPTASLSVTVSGGAIRDRLLDRLELGPVDLDVSILDDVPPFESPETYPENPVRVDDVDAGRIPGGVLCQVESGSKGSLAPRLYDGTGSEWFTTANHLFGAHGTYRFEHAGESLSVIGVDDQRRIARVVRGYPGLDVVRLRPVDGARPASRVDDRIPVVGQFTRYGLALLKAREVPLEKVGAASGHSSGHVRGVDGITCYFGEICKQGQLKWGDESVTTDGDSGSVNFAPDPVEPDGGVLVGGFNNARTWWPGANFAWGTAAHHLTETRGLHF